MPVVIVIMIVAMTMVVVVMTHDRHRMTMIAVATMGVGRRLFQIFDLLGRHQSLVRVANEPGTRFAA